MVRSKTAEEIRRMRKAGEIVASALAAMQVAVAPGVTTGELDRIAEALVREEGAIPSFKGYRGFPATICASVNDEIVHGIPSERRLAEGDIVSLDVGAIWEGYHGDAAITLGVGEITVKAAKLLDVTRAALNEGIAAARAGSRLGNVSHAIELVAREAGFEVVREYGGHGIGRAMHEALRIPNWGDAGQGIALRPGMTFALEPMFTAGGYHTRVLANHWTVVTSDGSLSAHFEHTIAITKDGAEILTRPA